MRLDPTVFRLVALECPTLGTDLGFNVFGPSRWQDLSLARKLNLGSRWLGDPCLEVAPGSWGFSVHLRPLSDLVEGKTGGDALIAGRGSVVFLGLSVGRLINVN